MPPFQPPPRPDLPIFGVGNYVTSSKIYIVGAGIVVAVAYFNIGRPASSGAIHVTVGAMGTAGDIITIGLVQIAAIRPHQGDRGPIIKRQECR